MTAPLFDDVVLAEMRALNRANLPFIASVSGIDVVDAGNRSMEERQVHRFDAPCRLAPANSDPINRLNADALASTNKWLIFFEAGVDVKAQSEVTIRGKIAGIFFERKFRVLGVQGPRANEIERGVVAEEIQSA